MENTLPHKAVIFDMDGVLINSEPIHVTAWTKVLESMGVFFSRKYFKNWFGIPDTEVAASLVRAQQLTIEPAQLLREKRAKLFELISESNDYLYPGVYEGLANLTGYRLGLSTSSHWEITRLILESTGLVSFFKTVVTSDDVEQTKPSPETYLKAATGVGVSPSACFAVEDTKPGILAAKKAGMHVIAVENSYDKEELQDADICLKTTANAIKWLNEQKKR